MTGTGLIVEALIDSLDRKGQQQRAIDAVGKRVLIQFEHFDDLLSQVCFRGDSRFVATKY